MSLSLRPYQTTLVASTCALVVQGKRPLLQAPTGAGKTVMATALAAWALAQGWTVFFACHRRELVQQTSLTFAAAGLAHGFIAAGRPHDPTARLFICSVDTLKSRHAKLAPKPDLVIWDECHHLGAAGWTKLKSHYSGARHIGLSATPQTASGAGLDLHFDELVEGPQPAWLIAQGSLSPYRYFAPSMPELETLGVRAGEYKSEDAEKAMTKELTGSAIDHYQQHCPGARGVAFCVSITHSKAVAQQFCDAGIPAAHLDGDTPDDERAETIRRYADGELRVLTNVGLFGEGFDLAALAGKPVTIDVLFMLRPTKSLGLCIQMWGRVLRPADGKVAFIFDHAGCAREHGLPDDERHHSLNGRVTGPKVGDTDGPLPASPATCLGCFSQIRRPLLSPLCPYCGGQLVEPRPLPKSNDRELRELKAAEMAALKAAKAQARADAEVARDLRDLEREAAKLQREADRAARQAAELSRKREREVEREREKAEEWACASKVELVRLARGRGYAYPTGYADKRWPFIEARRKRQGLHVA